MSLKTGGEVAGLEVNQRETTGSSASIAKCVGLEVIRELPSFWEICCHAAIWTLLLGNGLLLQLGYDTSSQLIRELILTKRPRLFKKWFAKFPENTELEQLMDGMEEEMKLSFQLALMQALNTIIGDAESSLHRAARFIAMFGNVFTLNLDTLQPKVYEHINANATEYRARFQDSFKMNGKVGIWSASNEQNWYYPHGNVILGHSSEPEVYFKFDRDMPHNLRKLDRTLASLQAQPMIILDSDSDAKMEKIQKITYLRTCLRRLGEMTGSICFYGLGLEKDTDKHFWTVVDDNKDIDNIYIAEESITLATLADVERLLPKKHMRVTFFDRDSI